MNRIFPVNAVSEMIRDLGQRFFWGRPLYFIELPQRDLMELQCVSNCSERRGERFIEAAFY